VKAGFFLSAALLATSLPSAARADDPNDPAMRSAAARARDRATIRQFNLQEGARVRERDAGYAEGWKAYAGSRGASPAQARRYQRELSRYDRERAQYERDLAAWRRAVAACRARDHAACDG